MTIRVTQIAVVQKSINNGTAITLSSYAVDTVGIGGVVIPSVDQVKDDAFDHFKCEQTRWENTGTIVQVVARESSTPKNALTVSALFSDYNAIEAEAFSPDLYASSPSIMHAIADERGNTICDQKMRGGIAG